MPYGSYVYGQVEYGAEVVAPIVSGANFLIQTQRWRDRKPNGPQEIDWTHPLAHGLAHAWLLGNDGGGDVIDIVGSNHGVRKGNVIDQNGPLGRELLFATSGDYLDCGDIGTTDFGDHGWSLLVVGRGSGYPICGFGSQGNNGWIFKRSDPTNAVEFTFLSVADYPSSLTSPSPNKEAVFGCVVKDTSATVALNGQTSSFTIGTMVPFTTNPKFIIGGSWRFGTFLKSLAGPVVSLYMWKRELTDDEIALATLEPYALLRPRRRRLFFSGVQLISVISDAKMSLGWRGQTQRDSAARAGWTTKTIRDIVIPLDWAVRTARDSETPSDWASAIHHDVELPLDSLSTAQHDRSEERRVGKECRSRWSPYH